MTRLGTILLAASDDGPEYEDQQGSANQAAHEQQNEPCIEDREMAVAEVGKALNVN